MAEVVVDQKDCCSHCQENLHFVVVAVHFDCRSLEIEEEMLIAAVAVAVAVAIDRIEVRSGNLRLVETV